PDRFEGDLGVRRVEVAAGDVERAGLPRLTVRAEVPHADLLPVDPHAYELLDTVDHRAARQRRVLTRAQIADPERLATEDVPAAVDDPVLAPQVGVGLHAGLFHVGLVAVLGLGVERADVDVV